MILELNIIRTTESPTMVNDNGDPTYAMPSDGDPNDRDCGFGVAEALDVIQALDRRGIPTCVTGEKALLYYGVRKVARVRASQAEQSAVLINLAP